VPSDLAPLGIARYGDAHKAQPLRISSGNIMSAQPQSNANSTARIEVIGGQPVVFVGDRMFALPAVSATDPTMSSAPSSADSMTKQVADGPNLNSNGYSSGLAFAPPRASTTTPFDGLDLSTLKAQQSLKRQELRTVEQTEVLQASHQSEAWRASMIEKKRCLIVELDALRRQIAALETDSANTVQPNPFPGATGTSSTSMPALANQFQQPFPQAMYAFPAVNPYASMMMYQPQPFAAFSSLPTAEPAPLAPKTTNPPHSPGSASRRSHAIEIKPPPEDSKKQSTSALDPKSPTYEPANKPTTSQGVSPPTPSPPKRSPWLSQDVPRPDNCEHRVPSQKPSLSSIDTTDFFPTNTHEHSSTRVDPQIVKSKQSANEVQAIPSTPEKLWPASPWNEGHTGNSKNNDPAPKLTSWPEAFGKQPSLTSLRQGAVGQALFSMLERAPAVGANMSSSASGNHVHPRTNSEQRTGTDENWPFSSKIVAHVPCTYQEGYQAGYDHVGIPDSPEVLQGYIQGLLHFLTDESRKRQMDTSARETYTRSVSSNTPSLRGLVAGSLPFDSAVSMTFNRNGLGSGGQENMRSTKGTLVTDARRDSAYSPQGSVRGGPVPYAMPSESIQEPRQRIASATNYINTAVQFPDTGISGHRQFVFSGIENDMNKGMQDKGISSRADSFLNAMHTRQTFGEQLQNRGYGQPFTTQRIHPTPKELSAGGFRGDNVPPARPFADHRMSGLDGAMDDLAELVKETGIEERRSSADRRSTEAPIPVQSEEVNASCFKSSGSKGKQKATSSPAKPTGATRDHATSSPANALSSPKKSGEHSPAKAKLEQVTNKFRRVKKDDPRAMSPDDRIKRSEKWRQRFQQLKRTEIEEIEEQRRNTRT
jgi:hypothetical protein